MIPRFIPAAALALTAAVALAGCSSSVQPTGSESSATPVDGGTLHVAYWPDNAALPCLDPFQVYWIEHRTVIRNFADSLTDQDPETGELKPWLATDWKVNDAGTEYTFDLRDDVTFSDGTKFTAESVKLALDSDAKTLETLPTAYGAVYLAGYQSTDVVDDDTVTITFSTPNAAFLQGTSTTNLAILAASSYELSPADRCLGGLVGSGPFTLDSYTPGESIVLKKRDGYAWGSELRAHTGAAYLDEIDFSFVAEDSVRVGQLVSGEIDVAWPRSPISESDQALIASAGDTVVSRSLPGPANILYPNIQDGHPLSDPAVRQAVQKTIDRSTFASTIFGSDYPAVSGVYDTTTPYYVDQSSDLTFDADGAASLLDSAGWTLDSDGYRYKDGKKLTLVLPVSPAATPADQLLQSEFAASGIDLQLDVVTAAQRSEALSSNSYDLIYTYYTRADPGVIQWIIDERVAGSLAIAHNMGTDADRAEIQKLLDEGTSTVDTTARADVYAQLQKYLIDNSLVFPFAERVQTAGFSSKVHGFRFTSESFGDFADTWIQP